MSSSPYINYKDYLKNHLKRGEQKILADHLNCQPAFLSQVLRGKPHLSLEQGLLATEYFRMNRTESEYFMNSLQYGRAGTPSLKNFFKKKMEEANKENRKVESKIGSFSEVSGPSKGIFYSSWKYTLIHVLLSLPSDNQNRLLQDLTGASSQEIEKILTFLLQNEMAVKKNGNLRPLDNRLHLDREDPLIGLHHRNFRSLALKELEQIKSDSIHYSAAIALSKNDAEKIRNLFLELIEKSETILKPSVEETSRILCLDYFEPGL